MTLEERARVIADLPGAADVYAIALKQLREAVDEALKRTGDTWPSGGEMET